MRGHRALVVAFVGLALAAIGSSTACGTEPVGVDACQKIERLRCECAPACNIDLHRPFHSGSSDQSDVASCTRYYEDQCLHGLVITHEPAPQAVNACIAAIAPINGACDCNVVKSPEVHPSCQFLVPVAPASSASDAGDAGDASDAADSG